VARCRPAALPHAGDRPLTGPQVLRDVPGGLPLLTLARLAATGEQRNDLVDRANAIRPRTVR
jgi:hypothetical protein